MFHIIKRNYRVLVFQFLCAIIAVSIGAMIGITLEFAHYRDTCFKNISIGQIAIDSNSKALALEKVQSQYQGNFEDVTLLLTLGNKTIEAPTSNFIKSSNIEELVTKAFEYSQNLSLAERYKHLTAQLKKDFEISYVYDNEAIEAFVDNFISHYSQEPSNATIKITTDGNISLTQEINGIHFDKQLLLEAVYNALKPQSSTRLAAQDNIINVDATSSILPQEAIITSGSLRTIDTRIASVSTDFTPGSGSAVNIGIAANTINGTLVMPGDTFSYNDIIGNTTLDKGYTYAPVIVNSQLTQGVGGGVCQVSSTLYNAILNVGIIPTERKPHSRPSTYLPLGLDAVIDWGNIDFKFINTLDYPLYITSYTLEDKIYVDIYSNESLKSTTYKFKSEVQKVLASTTKYIKDSSLPKGTKKLYSNGSTGYIVKVTRETYIDNTLINSEVLYYDTYAAIPTIYKMN